MSLLSTSPIPMPNLLVGTTIDSPSFEALIAPLENVLAEVTPLKSQSNRPITFTFDCQLKSLIYYHIEECTSAQALLQKIQQDDSVRQMLITTKSLGESTFYEANATRGSVQMLEVFDRLSKKVSKCLGFAHAELGDLWSIDGSLIDASLSMIWADYSGSQNKAKVHLGFDLNRGIPRKIHLTDGKAAERPFVSCILSVGQTGVLDRGYQDHRRFSQWIEEGKHFVARLKKNTRWQVLEELAFVKGGKVFFFARVQLGDPNHQMKLPVYLVGYRVRRKVYWVVTDRADLSAEQIAFIYSLRWEIETFFGWWKRHLKLYHFISRNQHGMLLQLLGGLIAYLLFVLYCYRLYGEHKPSIRRLRELRWRIRQETAAAIYLPNVHIHIDILAMLLLFHIHAIF